jgi:hypothetical protein
MGRAAEAAERIRKCFEDQDWSTLRSLYHEDAVQEWPQSGERFVGQDNIVAVAQNYPDLPQMKGFRVVAEADDLAVTELLLDYGGRFTVGLALRRWKATRFVNARSTSTSLLTRRSHAPNGLRRCSVSRCLRHRLGAGH